MFDYHFSTEKYAKEQGHQTDSETDFTGHSYLSAGSDRAETVIYTQSLSAALEVPLDTDVTNFQSGDVM